MSAYNTGSVKQDMPPPGGYEEINFRRIPAQRIIGYKSFFIASTILTFYSFFYYSRRHKYLSQLTAEYYDHVIAVEPLIMAESDRAFLRHLRHNRNVERDLMKNVRDWKVGTLWGSKVYKTIPDGALPTISSREYYGHREAGEVQEFYQPNRHVGFEDNTINTLG